MLICILRLADEVRSGKTTSMEKRMAAVLSLLTSIGGLPELEP
ncbi:MAG: hypothetical protein Q4C53_08050 [Clostridia bacterium]|nr:hypothetical protein [Clostridia bacterium]